MFLFFWGCLSEHSEGWRCGRDHETLAGSHEFKEKTFKNGKSVLLSWSNVSRASEWEKWRTRLYVELLLGSADSACIWPAENCPSALGEGKAPHHRELVVLFWAAQACTEPWLDNTGTVERGNTQVPIPSACAMSYLYLLLLNEAVYKQTKLKHRHLKQTKSQLPWVGLSFLANTFKDMTRFLHTG